MRRCLAIALTVMLCCLASAESGREHITERACDEFRRSGLRATIWIDPEHDLVVVWRWHQANPDELIRHVLASIND